MRETHTSTQTPNPIRKRRRQLGLTLRGLASLAGVTAPAVYLAEIGRRTLPVKLLRGLCDATGEPYERLLEDWLAWRTNGSHNSIDRLEGLIRIAASRVVCVGGEG